MAGFKIKSKFAYCPSCIFRTRILPGTQASDFYCPRHGYRLIYSGEETDLPWLG